MQIYQKQVIRELISGYPPLSPFLMTSLFFSRMIRSIYLTNYQLTDYYCHCATFTPFCDVLFICLHWTFTFHSRLKSRFRLILSWRVRSALSYWIATVDLKSLNTASISNRHYFPTDRFLRVGWLCVSMTNLSCKQEHQRLLLFLLK